MEALPASVREAIDDHLVQYAAALVADIAHTQKISAQYLALAVPGMCHSHAPSKKRKFDCAFCERRGNCFDADADATADDTGHRHEDDLVAKHVDALATRFAEQLLLFRRDIEAVIERVRGIVK